VNYDITIILVILGGSLVVALALFLQRKGLQIAQDLQEKAAKIENRAMEQVETELTISQKQLEAQKEIISLLQEVRDELKKTHNE